MRILEIHHFRVSHSSILVPQYLFCLRARDRSKMGIRMGELGVKQCPIGLRDQENACLYRCKRQDPGYLLSEASLIIAGAIKDGNLKVVPARYDITLSTDLRERVGILAKAFTPQCYGEVRRFGEFGGAGRGPSQGDGKRLRPG
jgi:hypothetical protein